MKNTFEIYALNDDLSPDDWNGIFQAVAGLGGLMPKLEIVFSCQDNLIRFFIRSNHDLSGLSNSIQGIVLRPVDEPAVPSPARQVERFIQFPVGGNILDLKERYAAKKAKELEYASFRIRFLGPSRAICKINLYFKNKAGTWSRGARTIHLLPKQLLAVDFKANTRYLKKSTPKYLSIEKALHMLVSDSQNAVFEVETFPYLPSNRYLNLTSYDFDKHSFIVGASGSGKSKLISLLVDRLSKTSLKMNYRVIVIDPHASIAEDLAHIPDSQVIAFGKEDTTELFPGAETDLTSATELTATLFKSVLADQFNPRLDRLLRFSLFTLLTAQTMSLENLKRFLTDVEYRNQIVRHVDGYIPQNVVKFFGADYNEIRTQYYNETILPLVSMVDEMQLQPSLVGESETSLAKTVQDNFLSVFSLNKVSMGEKVVKTVAGLLIQQIFLLAQAHAFGQKVILIVDEVSVIQNPTLAQILSEARKFNLTVILTQQYFGQVEKDLRDAIFSNVYNYYAFKVSEEDARLLEGNLNIELPKEVLTAEQTKGLGDSEVKVRIMTELHPRECLVRLINNGQMAPALKVRTVDAPMAERPDSAKKLTAVKPKLPEKFVEGQKQEKREKRTVHFSSHFLENIANAGAQPPDSSEKQWQTFGPIGNLRDLLASHSSSRTKISKKEDQK